MLRWFVRFLPRRVGGLLAVPYRPERHYMRGSGPACAARRASQPSLGQTV